MCPVFVTDGRLRFAFLVWRIGGGLLPVDDREILAQKVVVVRRGGAAAFVLLLLLLRLFVLRLFLRLLLSNLQSHDDNKTD